MAEPPLQPTAHEDMLRRNPLYRQAVAGEITDYKTSTKQFLQRVRQRHTAAKLKSWGLETLKAHEGETRPTDLEGGEVPTLIQNLDPPLSPFVTVFPSSHVRIDWGGGWGHWGLLIGGANFEPSNPDLYVLQWAPGIFCLPHKQVKK